MNAKVGIPLYVRIKHKEETFFIFTEEYKNAITIKEEISKIKKIPLENIKLYYNNKRIIEDNTTNHDQQIKHTTLLYSAYKIGEEWENINDIMNFKKEEVL